MSVATEAIRDSLRYLESLPHDPHLSGMRNMGMVILRRVEQAEREAGTDAARAVGQIVAAIMQHPKLSTCRVSVLRDPDNRCTTFSVQSGERKASNTFSDERLHFGPGEAFISRAVQSLASAMGYGEEWGVSPLRALSTDWAYKQAMREQESYRDAMTRSMMIPCELLEPPPAPPERPKYDPDARVLGSGSNHIVKVTGSVTDPSFKPPPAPPPPMIADQCCHKCGNSTSVGFTMRADGVQGRYCHRCGYSWDLPSTPLDGGQMIVGSGARSGKSLHCRCGFFSRGRPGEECETCKLPIATELVSNAADMNQQGPDRVVVGPPATTGSVVWLPTTVFTSGPANDPIAAAKRAGAKILEHDRENCPDCCRGITEGWLPCERHQDPIPS